MRYKLNYIETHMKQIMAAYPQYYEHILDGEELSDFILFLIDSFSDKIDRNMVAQESKTLISGDFFIKNTRALIYNDLDDRDLSSYAGSFEKHTEDIFMPTAYDVSCSRQIRYMPAQWHYESFFTIYFPQDGECEILFKNGEKTLLKKGEILILAPFVEHATPCYKDDQYLEYFLVRSSSFDKVFWEQLNSTTIMSHFFRQALKNTGNDSSSYLLFQTQEDEDIFELIEEIKKEIGLKENYSSQLINALMSVLFCLLLRRYEDNVVLSGINNQKWKVEFTKMFSFIQNNYATTSLQEVADECGYSAKQVGRIVRNYFNMSYTDMITFIRMDKAVSLLKENVLSMEEISSVLGYSDLSSFYRAFKKYYRETPIDYIKNMKE